MQKIPRSFGARFSSGGHLGKERGMAGRHTGSYLDRSNGWRAVAIPAEDSDMGGKHARLTRRSDETSD
jgi:hypothetical protein